MTEAAKEARRKYQREYYARTRERQKVYLERYWAKKAAQAAEQNTASPKAATPETPGNEA